MTAVIELGEVNGAVDAQWWPTRPRRRLDRRRLRVAAVGFALVALIGGAAAPAPPPLARLATVYAGRGAQILVDGGYVFVADTREPRSTLTAYLLPSAGGRPVSTSRWSVEMDMNADSLEVRDGVVVVQRWTGEAGGPHLETFDERTGVNLWRSPDLISGGDVSPDTFLLVGPGGRDVRLVDLHSGVPRWSLSVPADCEFTILSVLDPSPFARPDRLVEACVADSSLRVFDLVTGAALASRHVYLGSPVAPLPQGWPASVTVISVDGVIITAHSDSPRPTLDAYTSDSLRTLWSGRPFAPTGGIFDCGGALCIDAGNTEDVIDAYTGRLIQVRTVTGRPSHIRPSPAPTFVLVSDPNANPLSRRDPGLVDVVSIPVGQSVSAPDYEGALASSAAAVWAAVLSVDGTAPGGVAVRPLQPLYGVRADSCLTFIGVLACATATDAVTLWRLPDGLG